MEKIKINKENINEYYKKVNSLIDSYLEWKISPVKLKAYLKLGSPAFIRFKEKNNLTNIEGIDKVILDVVDDRAHMEKDKVMKFESFITKERLEELATGDVLQHSFEESDLFYGILPTNVEYEKILADHFEVSLAYVQEIDVNNHLYDVTVFNQKYNVFILTNDDMYLIRNNIVKNAYDAACKAVVTCDYAKFYLSKDCINQDYFMTNFELTEEILMKSISNRLNNEFTFKAEFKGHMIWVKNSELEQAEADLDKLTDDVVDFDQFNENVK